MRIPDVSLTYIAAEPFRSNNNASSHFEVTSKKDLIALLARKKLDWASAPKVALGDAVLFNLAYHDNYGHLMGETGPILHNQLCTYLGRQAALRAGGRAGVVPAASAACLGCPLTGRTS